MEHTTSQSFSPASLKPGQIVQDTAGRVLKVLRHRQQGEPLANFVDCVSLSDQSKGSWDPQYLMPVDGPHTGKLQIVDARTICYDGKMVAIEMFEELLNPANIPSVWMRVISKDDANKTVTIQTQPGPFEAAPVTAERLREIAMMAWNSPDLSIAASELHHLADWLHRR